MQFQLLQFIELLLGLILKYLPHRKKIKFGSHNTLTWYCFGRYYFFKLL